MIWEKTDIDPAEVRAFAEKYRLDLLPAAIFVRRGITDPDAVQYYLEDDIRFLHNPFLFDEMEDVVDRILTAVSEGERVLVFGDRDVDGITSIALAVRTLEELGLEVSWNLPRGDDPYGVRITTIDEFAARDGTLLICVDNGISAAGEIAHAQELGIDTIVLDHHNPQEEIPPAVAIVNPKMEDSGYPFEGLCGCALVAKLRWALAFGRTDFYKQTVCLLNIVPGNETLILEAVKLVNLVEVDRITENLVPGVVSLEDTRLWKFLAGQQILVYDAASQERMLRQVFGDRVEVNLLDLAPELWKAFPALADKSLLRLRQSSRMAIYGTQAPSEIDVLRSLFTLFVHRKEPSLSSEYRKSLDLVAVATLADMMPLHDENRILVRQGLAQLSDDPNKGLRELISRRGLLGKQLAAVDIAWQISPIVNAAGRMGSPERSVELLLASDLAEVQRIASEVVELNEARRRIGEEGWDRVIARAYESFQESGERMVYVADEGLQRGVTGIIAGRLARHFNVPAVVIAVLGERAVGSVRAMRGFGVTDFLRTLDDLLDDWGGHDAAGGFQLDASRLEGFFARLASAAPGIELSPEQEERIPIDAEIPHEYLEPKLQEVVAIFQPFGQENGPLHFLTRNMRIEQLDFIGRPDPKHVKFLLSAGKYKWPALFWNAAERAGKDFNVNEAVDVVFRLEKNFFQSRETLQLNVVDLKRSGS